MMCLGSCFLWKEKFIVLLCTLKWSMPAVCCSDAFESLAWASVQIHCQCTTNSKVAYPDGNLFTAEELSTANTGM